MNVQARRGVVGRAVEMVDEALFSPTLLRLPQTREKEAWSVHNLILARRDGSERGKAERRKVLGASREGLQMLEEHSAAKGHLAR